MSTNQIKTNWAQFIPLVTVFFFWGFVAASNDILIPVFKEAFDLSWHYSKHSLANFKSLKTNKFVFLVCLQISITSAIEV